MFEPMALTVIIALVSAFVLSLTFVPAMIAIVITGKVTEKDNFLIRGIKAAYRPVLGAALRIPMTFVAVALVLLVGAGFLFTRLGAGVHPAARREEHRAERPAHPFDLPDPVAGDAAEGRAGDQQIPPGRLRLLEDRHRGGRLRSDAAELVRHLRHPEAAGGMARSGPVQGRPAGSDREGARGARRQRLRVLPADPASLQRTPGRHPRRPRRKGVRRGVRADAQGRQPGRRDPARDRGRRRRQGRADGGPAVPGDQDQQDRGRTPRPEHVRDPGRHRRGHRRPRGRHGVRGRPALPHRRAPERQGARGPRGPGEHPGAAAPGRSTGGPRRCS